MLSSRSSLLSWGPVIASMFGSFFGAISGMVGIVIFIVFLLLAAIDLVAGIIGVKQCGDPSKALFFIIFGFIVGGLTLISLITNFNVGNIIGLVMPVLFIVGGFHEQKCQPARRLIPSPSRAGR